MITARLVLVLVLLVVPLAAEAQQAGQLRRIGYFAPPAGPSNIEQAFRQGLREHGWVEGQNIAIEWRFSAGNEHLHRVFAAEMVRVNADLIVAGGGGAALAAHEVTKTTPIVMVGVAHAVELGLVKSLGKPGGNVTGMSLMSHDLNGKRKVDVIVAPNPAGIEAAKGATTRVPIIMVSVSDPVRSGLVTSLARPGGNITGLSSTASSEMFGKRLELLREVVPKVSRVAFLRNPTNPDAADVSREVEKAGALLLLGDTMFFLHRARIATLAAKNRLPTVGGTREMADAGLLMTYGASGAYAFQRAATYVDKILRGAKPADLPVEQPTTFELVINTKTAKALGLTIPPSLLQRADQVIE